MLSTLFARFSMHMDVHKYHFINTFNSLREIPGSAACPRPAPPPAFNSLREILLVTMDGLSTVGVAFNSLREIRPGGQGGLAVRRRFQLSSRDSPKGSNGEVGVRIMYFQLSSRDAGKWSITIEAGYPSFNSLREIPQYKFGSNGELLHPEAFNSLREIPKFLKGEKVRLFHLSTLFARFPLGSRRREHDKTDDTFNSLREIR